MSYEDQLRDMANTDQGGYFGGTPALEEMIAIAKDRSAQEAQTLAVAAYGKPAADPEAPNTARLITNVPELRAAASTYIQPPSAPTLQAATQGEKTGIAAFLSSYEERLTGTNDFMGKQKILNELRDDAMARIGNAQKAALASVEKDMNLPPLRQALAKAIELDRRDTSLNGVDSEGTAKLRANVLKMEEEARKTSESILKSNPDMQRFAKSVDSTVQQHEKMAEKAFNDSVKLAEKKDAEKEQAKVVVSMLDPEARAAITRINPAMQDDVQYANFIMKGGGKNKDWQPILLGEIKDTDYVKAALTTNNLPARMLAINEESFRTNRDPQVVDQEMKKLEILSKNPNLALEALTKGGVFDGTDGQKRLKEIKAKLTIGDATTRKETTATLASMLPALSQRNAITESRNIPSQELMSDPDFNQVYTLTSQKKGQPATIQEAGSVWMKEEGISNSEKMRRQDIVVQAYTKEVAKRGQSGIFFQMDPGQVADESRKMKDALTASLVRDTLLQKMGALMGGASREASNFLQQASPQGLQMKAGMGVAGIMDEFIKGMNGGNR